MSAPDVLHAGIGILFLFDDDDTIISILYDRPACSPDVVWNCSFRNDVRRLRK